MICYFNKGDVSLAGCVYHRLAQVDLLLAAAAVSWQRKTSAFGYR